jgi:ketosteroid isomerase-like protein
MSQENVELALEVLAALSRRDGDALVALADPEVEWHSFFALGGVYLGYEGIRQFMRDLADAWEVQRADVDDQLGVDNAVLLVGRIHYRGKGSGVESETAVGWVLVFREGRLLRFRAFRDPGPALEAVGLSE